MAQGQLFGQEKGRLQVKHPLTESMSCLRLERGSAASRGLRMAIYQVLQTLEVSSPDTKDKVMTKDALVSMLTINTLIT